jgi:VanZ family protein
MRTAALVLAAGILLPLAPHAAHAQLDTVSSRTLLALHHREAARHDAVARRVADGTTRITHAPAPDTRPVLTRRGPANAGMYTLLLTGAAVYNALCPLGTLCDRDAGGYVDTYHSIDKVAHASSAMALTSFAIQGGVQPEVATALTIAGGVAFELTQTQGGGYYSARDVVANGTGALVALGWHRFWAWHHARPRTRQQAPVAIPDAREQPPAR